MDALELAKEMEFILEQRINGVSFAQIGAMLGVPKNTVYYKYNRFITAYIGVRQAFQSVLLSSTTDEEEDEIDDDWKPPEDDDWQPPDAANK